MKKKDKEPQVPEPIMNEAPAEETDESIANLLSQNTASLAQNYSHHCCCHSHHCCSHHHYCGCYPYTYHYYWNTYYPNQMYTAANYAASPLTTYNVSI